MMGEGGEEVNAMEHYENGAGEEPSEMEVYEEHKNDIGVLETAERTSSPVQGACCLLNGPSYMKKWDVDSGTKVDMRSGNEDDEDKVRMLGARTTDTPTNNHLKTEPIIEEADEECALSVNTDENTSTTVERLDVSIDQQITPERMKRAISSLRIAYAMNLDQAYAAGDVMVADSYRKAVKELDDAFLAIHSGTLNYTTLPPFPAPYKSPVERSIPYNLQSLSFPPGYPWYYFPYQYLPQPGIPGTCMPQFHMPAPCGPPYMYNAYMPRTGQQLSLHQNTPSPGFFPHASVMPPKLASPHSMIGQSVCPSQIPCDTASRNSPITSFYEEPQTTSAVTKEMKCVEEGEEADKYKPAKSDAEMRPTEVETSSAPTKSLESEAGISEIGSTKLDVATNGTKLGGSQVFDDGRGPNESQANDVKTTAVDSRTFDLETRPITSNALSIGTTSTESARSQAVIAEMALTEPRAPDVRTMTYGSEIFAGAVSVGLEAVAQAIPLLEAKSVDDERDDRNSILVDEVPIFISVDQRPPEFPAANYSNVVKNWAMHIINVQQLLQLLIDVVEYFDTKEITFNEKNFEQFCGRDMLPRLDCMDFGELIDSEIVLIRPKDFGFYLNPIFSELRFLVLTDLEWSIFHMLLEVGHIRMEDLADALDFGSDCDWIPRKKHAAIWEVLFSEKLRGVFVVEAMLRHGNKTEFWIRINRCLDRSNVVPRLIVFP